MEEMQKEVLRERQNQLEEVDETQRTFTQQVDMSHYSI